MTTTQRTSLLAGWLFADLFLVLFVVGIASIPPMHAATQKHKSHPRQSRSLAKPVSITVNVSPSNIQDPLTEQGAAARLISRLKHDLAVQGLQDRQAGVFLVFASGPSSAIDQAISNARSVVRITKRRIATFSKASTAAYWSGQGDSFKFEIFFYTVVPAH